MATFLIMLREGAEAAVLLGILFTYLHRTGRSDRDGWVWLGAAAAVVVSAGAGWALHRTVGGLEGRAEEIVDGVVALVAVAVLTSMLLWMASHSAAAGARLAREVDAAISRQGTWLLATVAFVVVIREGLEATLFLIASTAGTQGAARLTGGLAGLAAAALVGYLVYRGGTRFDLRLFFRVTGVLILLFAAGLVARGVHEFQEAGLLPALIDPVWSLGFGNPDTSVVGRVAEELFGWTPSPSLLQILAYWAYLIPVGWAFSRVARRRVPLARSVVGAPEKAS